MWREPQQKRKGGSRSHSRTREKMAGAATEQEKKMAGATAEQENKDGGSHSRKEKGKKL